MIRTSQSVCLYILLITPSSDTYASSRVHIFGVNHNIRLSSCGPQRVMYSGPFTAAVISVDIPQEFQQNKSAQCHRKYTRSRTKGFLLSSYRHFYIQTNRPSLIFTSRYVTVISPCGYMEMWVTSSGHCHSFIGSLCFNQSCYSVKITRKCQYSVQVVGWIKSKWGSIQESVIYGRSKGFQPSITGWSIGVKVVGVFGS